MKLETFLGRSFPTFPPWIRPLPIILSFLTVPSLSHSQPWNYQEAGEINPTEFLAVSSDQEATSVFRETFGKTLGFTPPQPKKRGQKAKSQNIASEITDEISQFMAHAIISIRANRFQTVIQVDGLQSLGQLRHRETPQFLWLVSKTHSNELNHFMDLTATIFKLSQEMVGQQNQPPPQFSTFARHVDQTYPQLVNGQDSWVSILEEKGTEAITNRFKEFWEKQSINSSPPEPPLKVPPDQQQEYVHYYVKTRLLPVFVSHLVAKSIRLQAGAEYQAGQSWIRLRKWNESQQKIRALTRLCGIWQWTVHNHQNHQDHKMTLSFAPSSQQTPGQPQPDVIIMNGDTIYLKWNSPSGYQEDSLLLSNRDQRLEGTFKHSRGPQGNISGKRLSNCSR
jgi:hypothetical protein